MPTVPVLDQTAGGATSYRASDAAPQQQEATQPPGMTIGDRLAEQVDDATVKTAETAALGQAQSINYDPQTGFFNQQGQNAVAQYEPAKQAVNKAFQDQLDSLSNPIQKYMFQRVTQQHLLTIGQQMSIHAFQQTSRMAGQAAADRANTYATSASNAYASYGQTDADGKATGAFASNLGTAENETLNAVQIMKGSPAGSDDANAALLNLHTQIAAGAITQMMDARAPFAKVQQMYDDMQTKWGLQGTDNLGRMVKAYTEQESTRATVNRSLSDAIRASQGQPTSSTGTPDYQFPARGGTTTAQPYNPEQGAVMLNLPQGSNIQAPADGKVTQAGKDADGNFSLQIQHANGSVTTFTGLNAANVKAGDQVQRGEDVATSAPSVLWSLTDKDGNAVDPTRAGLAPVDLARITDDKVLDSALNSMRAQVTDPHLQQQAASEMVSIVRNNQQMVDAAETQLFKQASDAFYNGGTQWRSIPPSIFNQLSPAQQQQFKDAQTAEILKNYTQGQRFKQLGATALVSGFIAHPATLTPANVDAARPKLSNATYQMLMGKAQELQSNPLGVSEANAVNSRIKFFAGQSGVNVDPTTPEDKQVLIGLTYRVQQDLDRLKAQNHGNVTPDQVDKTIQQELIQRAFAAPPGANSPAQTQNAPMPNGATHVVPGSDGRMHYTDGTNDLGVVNGVPTPAASAPQSGGSDPASGKTPDQQHDGEASQQETDGGGDSTSGEDGGDSEMDGESDPGQQRGPAQAIDPHFREPMPSPVSEGTTAPKSGAQAIDPHLLEPMPSPVSEAATAPQNAAPPADGHADTPAQKAAKNVDNARASAGTDRYDIKAWVVSDGQLFKRGSDKCNLYVSEMMKNSTGKHTTVEGTGKIARAAQFADPKVKITGLSAPEPMANARPGDVIAQDHGPNPENGNVEGHVGIIVSLPHDGQPGQTASASLFEGGKVVINDWGFRDPNAKDNNGERQGAKSPPPVVRHPL